MPFPSGTFLEAIRGTLVWVADEFEHLYAQLEGFLSREHRSDGSHGDVTAASMTSIGAVTALRVSVAGTQASTGTGRLAEPNILIGDQPAVGTSQRGYGIKLGRWRILEDRDGPALDLQFQLLDIFTGVSGYPFKFGVSAANEWALQAGLGAGLRVGTSGIPLIGVDTQALHATTAITLGPLAVLIKAGAGTPEGVLAAPVGSLFLSTDAGTGSTLWVKETGGTGNTGWVAK